MLGIQNADWRFSLPFYGWPTQISTEVKSGNSRDKMTYCKNIRNNGNQEASLIRRIDSHLVLTNNSHLPG